jgi:DNA-binding transcriptional regulator YhcF (GntR family)
MYGPLEHHLRPQASYRGGMSDERNPAEPSTLGIAVDRDAEVPLGLQLGWSLSARIRDGTFAPGQRLPGLREMALASGLNINTVRAVYQRLEQRGLIESLQGSGTFVAATPGGHTAVATIAADAAREAHATGVDPREVATALYVASEATGPTATSRRRSEAEQPDEGSERRRALRAQIAVLERAIGEIEAEYPGIAPAAASGRRGPGPTLLSAEQLEQVRSGLVRRLAAVQAAIDERDAQQALRADALARKGSSARQAARARPHSEAEDERDDGVPAPKRTPRPRTSGRPATA